MTDFLVIPMQTRQGEILVTAQIDSDDLLSDIFGFSTDLCTATEREVLGVQARGSAMPPKVGPYRTFSEYLEVVKLKTPFPAHQ